MEVAAAHDPLPDALSMRHLTAVRAPQADGVVHHEIVPFAILVEALTGRYRVRHSGRAFDGPPGTVIVIPPRTRVAFEHSREADPVMSARFAHVSFLLWNAIDPFSLVDPPLVLEGEAAREAGSLMARMIALPADLDPVAAAAERLAVGSGLLRILLSGGRPRPGAEDRLRRASGLAPVIRAMRERRDERLGIDDLAAIAHCSRATLHRRFLDALGTPPLRYLKELRLDDAARLLTTTDDPTAAIATAVGFVNPFHFSREFSARFGRSPTAYRRDALARLGTGADPGNG